MKTPRGMLLLDPEHKGRVYVRGIYVQTDPDLRFGYDLQDADLDRDRKMVASWNLKYLTKGVLMDATSRDPNVLRAFAEAVADGVSRTRSFVLTVGMS